MKRSTKVILIIFSVALGLAALYGALILWIGKEIDKCFEGFCVDDELFEEEKDVIPEIVDLREERE